MEALLNTFGFWSVFAFTIGPLWIGIMEAARHQPFGKIYKNYFIYLVVVWFPMIIAIGMIVHFLGQLNPKAFIVLYFVGGIVILHLAYKTLQSSHLPDKKFSLDWKAISVLGFANPKVWLIVPPGFISATFSDSLPLNILLFYLASLPIFSIGLFFWCFVGLYGAKLTRNKLGYFSSALLVGFSVYLLYQGFNLV